MTRIRGYKYRAYPNKKQRELFEKTFGSCRRRKELHRLIMMLSDVVY